MAFALSKRFTENYFRFGMIACCYFILIWTLPLIVLTFSPTAEYIIRKGEEFAQSKDTYYHHDAEVEKKKEEIISNTEKVEYITVFMILMQASFITICLYFLHTRKCRYLIPMIVARAILIFVPLVAISIYMSALAVFVKLDTPACLFSVLTMPISVISFFIYWQTRERQMMALMDMIVKRFRIHRHENQSAA